MTWRNYFLLSKNAVKLEALLNPKLIEHHGVMKSTANTDTYNKIIILDVSQPPLKTALSYAYELKNLENAEKYSEINNSAKKRSITKLEYVNSVIKLEAEAIFFRCQVFRDIEAKDCNLPFKKDYLEIYDSVKNKELSLEDGIKKISLYIQEHGIVKREYSTKKYYSDCYDFYAKKKLWPSFYDDQPKKETIVLNPDDIKNDPKI